MQNLSNIKVANYSFQNSDGSPEPSSLQRNVKRALDQLTSTSGNQSYNSSQS